MVDVIQEALQATDLHSEGPTECHLARRKARGNAEWFNAIATQTCCPGKVLRHMAFCLTAGSTCLHEGLAAEPCAKTATE